MTYATSKISHQFTPNPDSVKFVSDVNFIESGMCSFNNAQEASEHSLGKSLFALDGVVNVFILPQFVTITKKPSASWDALLQEIKEVLSCFISQR